MEVVRFGLKRQDVMGADVDDATAERLVKSLDLNGRSGFTKAANGVGTMGFLQVW